MSFDQKKSWVLQSLSTTLFWISSISFLRALRGVAPVTGWPSVTPLQVLLAVHGALVFIGASCWLFLERHNPTHDSCFSRLLPDSSRWTKQQYCAVHKAKIEGLDHHCTWLNVSVGRSNYVPFFVLTVCGALQFTLQVVVCGLMARPTALVADGDSATVIFGLWAAGATLAALLSAYIASNYGTLLLFHLMLARRGISTYDWLLDRRKKKSNKKAAEAGSSAASKPAAPDASNQDSSHVAVTAANIAPEVV